MFRLYGKVVKNNAIVNHHVVAIDDPSMDPPTKLKRALEGLCDYFDIENPLWQSDHTKGIRQVGKAKFIRHHFIDDIDFDYFEIEIIEG